MVEKNYWRCVVASWMIRFVAVSANSKKKKFKQKLWIFGMTIILNTSIYFFIALSVKKYPYV